VSLFDEQSDPYESGDTLKEALWGFETLYSVTTVNGEEHKFPLAAVWPLGHKSWLYRNLFCRLIRVEVAGLGRVSLYRAAQYCDHIMKVRLLQAFESGLRTAFAYPSPRSHGDKRVLVPAGTWKVAMIDWEQSSIVSDGVAYSSVKVFSDETLPSSETDEEKAKVGRPNKLNNTCLVLRELVASGKYNPAASKGERYALISNAYETKFPKKEAPGEETIRKAIVSVLGANSDTD